MIAVDTNVLVHAHRRDAVHFGEASAALRRLAGGQAPWALPWPCVSEFLSVVTNPRGFRSPSPLEAATRQVEAWLGAPAVHVLSEGRNTWPLLQRLLLTSKVSGARVHDAEIAAICLDHGVSELWTADRDYGRFPELRTRNPLIGSRP